MSSENLALIQSKLPPGSTAIIHVHEANLQEDWLQSSRILCLASNGTSVALLLFNSATTYPQTLTDLFIDKAIPIDSHFEFAIDTDTKQKDGPDLYVMNISSQKLTLVFEMVSSVKTSNFVDELYKATDEVKKRMDDKDDFQWLTDCTNNTIVDINDEKLDVPDSLLIDSPDVTLQRDSIAKGAAPIPARESAVRYQMSMKEDDYTYVQSLRVFIGTWNVNGQPPSLSLSDWLACDLEPPDIYAIGFQELDLSKEAFLFNDTPREEEWMFAVSNGLHKGAEYERLATIRLVGMMLILYVKNRHARHVRGISVNTVGTGIMGKMGNKGGVAVRFEIYNTSMCFVNSHLAAHIEEFERRNQDYRDICSRMSFTKFRPPKSIMNHDQVYWLGDLNYRIVDIDPRKVKELIDNENYQPVLEYDQLIKQHQKNEVFIGYKEGKINFRPTYKYDTGTDSWDSSEKNRAPAWCDRILWKGDSIKQLDYRSHPILRISDHKPVSAIFESKVRVIDTVKYRKIHEEVMKKLDKLENEFLPQVMVDTTDVIFDTLRFLEPQTKELIIANTGQVPVQFEFIKKLDDTTYCKEWLHIEPYLGSVMPGEKCDIRLEVYVDKRSASKLNSGQDKLYDILVLHLDGGKDIFITVTGSYERSCFGSSLETLANITVPMREIPVGKLMEMELENRKQGWENSVYSVPKEVWFLIDYLYRYGLKEPNLFEQSGLHAELIQIRNWLDNGSQEALSGSVHSIAEALLLLLECTAEPVIPYNFHSLCTECASNYLQCKQIIQQLPDLTRNVFLYLCVFLQELLSHASENGLDVKTMATLFGAIFIRDPPRSRDSQHPRAQQMLDRKKANFVYHFLVNDQSDNLVLMVT